MEIPIVVPLKDAANSIFMGVNLARVPPPAGETVSVPVIHVKDLTDGILNDAESLETVEISESFQLGRQRLQTDDLLISARGTLMKTTVIHATHSGTIASANFIVVRMGENPILSPVLLNAFLQQPRVLARVLSRAPSTAQSALTIRDLETLPIPIPAPELQPVLAHFLKVSEDHYRTAIDVARLRKEEAMEILAQYMDLRDAS